MIQRLPLAELHDYTATAPSQESDRIDRDICRGASCERCHQQGLRYLPFTKFSDRARHAYDSYRAFAQCPICGHTTEF